MNYQNRLEVKIHPASQGGEIFKITPDDNFFGQGVIAGNNDYNFGSNIHLAMREGLNLDQSRVYDQPFYASLPGNEWRHEIYLCI